MSLGNEKMKKYIYKVYGLIIESEIFMPELLATNNEESIDITISYAAMSEAIKQEIQEGKECNFEKKEMWFSIKEVATYYICNGDTIIVDPYPNSNEQYIKTYLLGSAFGMLLIQRNTVAIHGGTVVIDGQAIVITGDSGAGKSTLTSAFRNNGYFFMADDVSVTAMGMNSVPMIYPGYPQQKLCKDAMIKMGYDTDKFIMVDEEREKYVMPVHESFIKDPLPIGAICVLTLGEGNNVEIEEITGHEKIITLLKNIYRIEVTNYSGLNKEYFGNCISIVKNVPFLKVRRPKNKFSVEEQISIIEDFVKEYYKKLYK